MSDKPETCDQCGGDPVGGTLFSCFECRGHFCGGCMSYNYCSCSECEAEAEGSGNECGHMTPDAMHAVRRAALEEAASVCERDADNQQARGYHARAAEATRLAVVIRGLIDQPPQPASSTPAPRSP